MAMVDPTRFWFLPLSSGDFPAVLIFITFLICSVLLTLDLVVNDILPDNIELADIKPYRWLIWMFQGFTYLSMAMAASSFKEMSFLAPTFFSDAVLCGICGFFVALEKKLNVTTVHQ